MEAMQTVLSALVSNVTQQNRVIQEQQQQIRELKQLVNEQHISHLGQTAGGAKSLHSSSEFESSQNEIVELSHRQTLRL